MNVPVRRPIFRRRPESNIYRMFFWVITILGGIWLIRQVQLGNVKPLFQATPTPTRTAASYTLEGDAQFTAGQLNAAIKAYNEAVQVDPNNAQVWAQLARIQTYSSALLITDADQSARLQQALTSINQAEKLAPDDSTVHAIRAFVLDWNANPNLVDEKQVESNLTEAEQEAVRALQLDNTNTLALAFYAEILVDQQKWTQAQQNIQQALDRNSNLMDVYRVNAYVEESLGDYNAAIQSYDKAIALAPNLTFLYLRAGANYRTLGFKSPNEETQTQLFDKSLEYFAKAASINDQLGVKDPTPYLSIARTYSQEGEYFAAARNAQKALQFEPANADIYGQLGVIYFKSRNYEGSIPTLKCAIRGCSGEDSCIGRGLPACDTQDQPVQVTGLPLSPSTLVYYYTYGSVLAALSRPQQNYCTEAMDILGQVQAQYGGDSTVAGIVNAGEAICQSLAEGGTPTPLPGLETPTLIPITSTPAVLPTIIP